VQTQTRGSVLLAVESPAKGVRLIRVAGDLDGAATPRITALTDALLRRITEEKPTRGGRYLLIDLSCVSSFGPGGAETLLTVRDQAALSGVQVLLTGISGRQWLLPGQVVNVLMRISSFPTVECALRNLGVA